MKKSLVRRPLQYLIRAEKHIAARVHLSNMIERLLDNHDDQLDYTYKHAREEGFKVARKNYEDELEKQKLELGKAHNQHLLEQAKKHQKRVDELKVEIAKKPQPIMATLGETVHTGLIVQNWHTAWKWISTWAFGLIAYVSVAGIPPEVLALVPEASQSKVTAALALLGFVGRFINQSRSKPLPPVQEET
ncbi:hypothetical protein QTA56_07475 [Acinetobacter sp. VNH17]|uniref:Uncharacterized protein n=1 Tax=Acinetobacter thutiue TaxID=2998078 RepID=A0ABT7WN16_9GAMM|nr:hypothetical protein [Acinetobacter thutiue]MCY6411972.1 hypothetical protein [Acinetobacter thutiue]MDN0014076.1 hypothetical protein [Acinetobacter thutiue]